MKTVECSHESDVLDALTTSQWPERVDEPLRRHVASCAICTDLIAAVAPILEDRDGATDAAHIPSSAVMWWKAQMRARREAAREVARPITVAQGVAAAATLAAAVAIITALSPWLRSWFVGMPDLGTFDGARTQVSAVLLSQGWWLPVLAIGVWSILTPLAIYFAVAED